MCKKTNFNRCPSEIDKCMRGLMLITERGLEYSSLNVVACCCGHGIYPLTIVIKDNMSGKIYELMSGKSINRKKKFYKRDKKGYYYIPETVENEVNVI